jgi:hypothetical protein
MTAPRSRSLSLELDGEGAGTALGAIAWVLGALEIMKDRGHAESDERFHDLYESLAPRLEALLATFSTARRTPGEEEALQREIEDAYQTLRSAFETWIELTAVDTFSVAAEQRQGGVPGGEDGDGGADEPPSEGTPG